MPAYRESHLLVESVEEEDERDDSVGGVWRLVDGVLRRADRLDGEADGHAYAGREEEEATTPALDLERGEDSPAQVPNGQDTGDEQLDVRVGDADRVEDLAKVVRDETVARPLREPSNGDDDAHPPAVAGSLDERKPADVLAAYT